LPLSALFIVILFVLQFINRRFLLMFPVFRWLNRLTMSCDTYLLYIFLLISVISTLLGLFYIFYPSVSCLVTFASVVKTYVVPGVVILGSCVITFFWFWGKKFNRWLLAKQLKKSLHKQPYREPAECKQCNSKNAYLERSVLSWNRGVETIVCRDCGHTCKRDIELQIGEVQLSKEV
jgi:hypothetical protein